MKEMENSTAENNSGDTSDEEVHSDVPSDASTPSPIRTPFRPQFEVVVSYAVKDGDSVRFTIDVSKIEDDEIIKQGSVERQYEDLEWLQHCLITQNDVSGIIIPPLPPRPDMDARSAESKSKKQFGSGTKILVGDEFHKDCRNVKKYLTMMINHEVLGRDKALNSFLLEKEAPLRTRIRKGLMSKFSSAVEEARKGGHRDIEEQFQKTREWTAEYLSALKESSVNFHKMVTAENRLAESFSLFSTSLTSMGQYDDDTTHKISMLSVKLSEVLEDAKHGLEVQSVNDSNTLGYQLEMYTRYTEALKEMLFRRTCLLVDYQDSNRALEKAKPVKKQAAEEAKINAEKAYDDCTEMARRELKTFLQHRLLSFHEALSLYTEAQIKTSRDTYALLAKSLTVIKQMDP